MLKYQGWNLKSLHSSRRCSPEIARNSKNIRLPAWCNKDTEYVRRDAKDTYAESFHHQLFTVFLNFLQLFRMKPVDFAGYTTLLPPLPGTDQVRKGCPKIIILFNVPNKYPRQYVGKIILVFPKDFGSSRQDNVKKAFYWKLMINTLPRPFHFHSPSSLLTSSSFVLADITNCPVSSENGLWTLGGNRCAKEWWVGDKATIRS